MKPLNILRLKHLISKLTRFKNVQVFVLLNRTVSFLILFMLGPNYLHVCGFIFHPKIQQNWTFFKKYFETFLGSYSQHLIYILAQYVRVFDTGKSFKPIVMQYSGLLGPLIRYNGYKYTPNHIHNTLFSL